MGGGKTVTDAVVVAGLGCRRGVALAAVLAILRDAEAASGARPTRLAIPDFKREEVAFAAAAAALGLPLCLIGENALAGAQEETQTQSDAARRATGFAAIAEAAALAALAPGARLILPRITGEGVTCALAEGVPR